ncbi:hypothetical protein DVO68_25420 [Shigella sonnei]|nr:hypothetical protein [Escherichia coli]EFY1070750.1 hypothetical protein [Shigella flexneri]EFY1707828.1 hypothetical protein [Shigella sonnei]EFY2462817.1 hypothetical protein [Shigella sonnei]CSG47990.1 Uncharacterised protein [Shigella sonnei]
MIKGRSFPGHFPNIPAARNKISYDFINFFAFQLVTKCIGKSFGGRHVRFLLNIGRTDTRGKAEH